MDVKKVRRSTAAVVRPYRTGSHDLALRTAGDQALLSRARDVLRARVYSNSTVGPRRSRLRTVKKLLKRAGHRYLPASQAAMTDLVACLHSGGHRSVGNYLSDWRREHLSAGHEWGEALAALRKDCVRASERGQGPAKQAETFGAERLPRKTDTRERPVVKGGPKWPWLLLTIGTCWLLREAELADVLREQGSIDLQKREATLDLAATKADQKGRGCLRTLTCLCDTDLAGPCPFCALVDLLHLHATAGYGPKDPLFPTRGGRAASSKAVIRTLCRLLGLRLTGHSLRREGAQLYARRGLFLYLIQFLGRWGGRTVERYVAEALRGQLAKSASVQAAGSGTSAIGLSRAELLKTLERLVAEALAQRAVEGAAAPSTGPADPFEVHVARSLETPGGPNFSCPLKVRSSLGPSASAPVHDILLCDPAVPRAAWVTRCAWRFGDRPHEIIREAETTCGNCISKRAIEKRGRKS